MSLHFFEKEKISIFILDIKNMILNNNVIV